MAGPLTGKVALVAGATVYCTGRLDLLVNDIWGGELLAEWDTPVWNSGNPHFAAISESPRFVGRAVTRGTNVTSLAPNRQTPSPSGV